jgi:hypothetical protein
VKLAIECKEVNDTPSQEIPKLLVNQPSHSKLDAQMDILNLGKYCLLVHFFIELSQSVLDILSFPRLSASGEESMEPKLCKGECLNPLSTKQRSNFLFKMKVFPQLKEILLFQQIWFFGLSMFPILRGIYTRKY